MTSIRTQESYCRFEPPPSATAGSSSWPHWGMIRRCEQCCRDGQACIERYDEAEPLHPLDTVHDYQCKRCHLLNLAASEDSAQMPVVCTGESRAALRGRRGALL